MSKAKSVLVGVALLLGVVGASGLVYHLQFYRHKADLTAELTRYTQGAEGYEEWLAGRTPAEPRLREFADATLGFTAETVESRLRSGLNRMAASAGLVRNETVVTARSTPVAVANPALAQRRPVVEFQRFMRVEGIDVPDVFLLDAEVRGSGPLDAAVRLLALAQSQPWIWSVRRFSIVPQGNQSEVFDISVSVSTALLPDLAPEGADEGSAEDVVPADPPPIRDPDSEHVLATSAIVTRNVFAPPPPEPDPAPAVVARRDPEPRGEVRPNPPPPPYHEWRLTGFSESPGQGARAWLVNTRTGAALRLGPGERVLDAVLVDAGASGVVFSIGEARYTLSLNETLADRHPVE